MPLFRRKKSQPSEPVPQPIASAKGVNGELQLFDQVVRIKRKSDEKDIRISTISSIQFRRPGRIANGFLQFSFAGGNEAREGVFEAAGDENSIMFTRKQQGEFEKFKAELDRKSSGG